MSIEFDILDTRSAEVIWTKGYSGNYENELADRLALLSKRFQEFSLSKAEYDKSLQRVIFR